mmetsp:Transcript_16251/g.46695  ORF Transcript_16251/g.46695 Transcript_16251/m.46695 type:complete len:208 (+) Transcript_16251:734-1357(+)
MRLHPNGGRTDPGLQRRQPDGQGQGPSGERLEDQPEHVPARPARHTDAVRDRAADRQPHAHPAAAPGGRPGFAVRQRRKVRRAPRFLQSRAVPGQSGNVAAHRERTTESAGHGVLVPERRGEGRGDGISSIRGRAAAVRLQAVRRRPQGQAGEGQGDYFLRSVAQRPDGRVVVARWLPRRGRSQVRSQQVGVECSHAVRFPTGVSSS